MRFTSSSATGTVRAVVLLASMAVGCGRSGPSPEEQARADAERDRKLQAEIERSFLPLRNAIQAFLRATSSGDFEGAYALLAPSYTNMVSRESFVERIKTNKNFAKEVEAKILHTRWQAGTTRARVILGDLGLAEILFADTPTGPRISAITLGGMPALPPP